MQEFDTRLEVEVVHVVSDPELVLCLVSAAVVVVEAKLRLSRSSVRSSATGSIVVVERMVVGSGWDSWVLEGGS